MATFTVNTAADAVDAGDGLLSLREAVAAANATAAADTIRFADALDGRRLTLTQGQLVLNEDAWIDAAGSGVTLDAGAKGRALAVTGAGTEATVAGLAIVNGFLADGDGAGILLGSGASLALQGCRISGNLADFGRGGGVFAEAGSRLELRGSTVQNNGASEGGGIAGTGGVEITVVNCRVLDNGASGNGGGIALADGGALALADTLVRGNFAGFYSGDGGGGIWASRSSVALVASAVVGNQSVTSGGGLSLEESSLLADRTTIAGNIGQGGRAGDFSTGGAIQADGSSILFLKSSTVTGNTAGSTSDGQPEVYGFGGISGGELRLADTIVAGNFGRNAEGASRATDVEGAIAASNGHNIFGSDVAGAVAGDREGVSPAKLFAAVDPATGGGQVAHHGGPAPSVKLRDALDNPALSGGEPAATGDLDQRGAERPLPGGSSPDAGAFELDQTAISRVASAGNDLLTGGGGEDALAGLAGADRLDGQDGNDRLSGNDGGDTLAGGLGDDVLDGGKGSDTASYRDAGGAVAVSLALQTSSGDPGVDRLLRLENLEGGRFNDRLEGDALANVLGGGEGDDRLAGRKGADGLVGGAGADRLTGGLGADLLAGGTGRDVFDYDAPADSAPGAAGRDLVLDFESLTDRFDLSTLDARAATTANDAFAFLAPEGAAFTAAGQVRWFQDGGATFAEANTDGDPDAELAIEIAGLRTLSEADFLL